MRAITLAVFVGCFLAVNVCVSESRATVDISIHRQLKEAIENVGARSKDEDTEGQNDGSELAAVDSNEDKEAADQVNEGKRDMRRWYCYRNCKIMGRSTNYCRWLCYGRRYY